MSRPIVWLLLLAFALLPIFWSVGPEITFTGGYYEIFHLKPLAPVHLIVTISLIALTFFYSRMKYKRIPITYIAFIVYLPLVVVFSSDVMLHRDIYLHGAAVKNVLGSGHTGPVPTVEHGQWPVTYILWSVAVEVLKLDIVTTNVLLYLAIQFLVAVSIFLLSKNVMHHLNYGEQNAELMAVLAILLMTNHYNIFIQYSDAFFGYAIMLLLIWLMVKNSRGKNHDKVLRRKSVVLELTLYIFLLYLHPFYATQFLCIVTVLGLMQVYKRWNSFHLTRGRIMFTITSYIVYLVYQAVYSSTEAILKIARGEMYGKLLSTTSFFVEEPLPLFGVIMRQTFKVLLIILVILSLFTILSRKREITPYKMLAIGYLTGAGLLLVIFYYVPGFLGRVIQFTSLGVALLSALFLAEKMKNSSKGLTAIVTILIALVALTTFSLVFEAPIFGRSITPSVVKGLSFAVENSRDAIYLPTEPIPLHVYLYFLCPNLTRVCPVVGALNLSHVPNGLVVTTQSSEVTFQTPLNVIYDSHAIRMYYNKTTKGE